MRLSDHTTMVTEETRRRYAEGIAELESFLAAAKTKTARAGLRHALSSLKRMESRSSRKRKSKLSDDLKRQKAQNDRSREAAGNGGQRWTGPHDFAVMNSPLSDVEIGREIGRSVKAIRVRRVLLSKRSNPA